MRSGGDKCARRGSHPSQTLPGPPTAHKPAHFQSPRRTASTWRGGRPRGAPRPTAWTHSRGSTRPYRPGPAATTSRCCGGRGGRGGGEHLGAIGRAVVRGGARHPARSRASPPTACPRPRAPGHAHGDGDGDVGGRRKVHGVKRAPAGPAHRCERRQRERPRACKCAHLTHLPPTTPPSPTAPHPTHMSLDAQMRPSPVRFHTGPRKSFQLTLDPTEPP